MAFPLVLSVLQLGMMCVTRVQLLFGKIDSAVTEQTADLHIC